MLADEEIPQEGEPENRAGGLHPVGRALRETFDAENHATLGSDLTGLMLALARIDPDAPAPLPGRGAMPPPHLIAPPPPVAAPPASWWRQAMDRLLR